MKRAVIALLPAVLAALVSGCAGSGGRADTPDYAYNEDDSLTGYSKESYMAMEKELSDRGLLGDHQLNGFKLRQQTTGQTSGSFFLGSGGLSSTVTSGEVLRFAWTCKGVSVISTVPVDRILIITDETKKRPTVRFKYNLSRVLTKHLDSDNPNDYITPDVVRYVTVRISKKQQERELYLPAAS